MAYETVFHSAGFHRCLELLDLQSNKSFDLWLQWPVRGAAMQCPRWAVTQAVAHDHTSVVWLFKGRLCCLVTFLCGSTRGTPPLPLAFPLSPRQWGNWQQDAARAMQCHWCVVWATFSGYIMTHSKSLLCSKSLLTVPGTVDVWITATVGSVK